MEETAKLNAEDNAGVSESSTGEQALENLSREELLAALKKEQQAKTEAIQHMRSQQKKHESEKQSTQTVGNQDVDQEQQVRNLIREEARKVVYEEQKEARVAEFAKGTTDWLKAQSWAKEVVAEGADATYAQFAKELQRLSREKNVDSREDYQRLMRLAVVNVTGRPDALLEQSSEKDIRQEKSQSFSYNGSSGTSSEPNLYAGLNDKERAIMENVNAARIKRGEKPLSAKDVLK